MQIKLLVEGGDMKPGPALSQKLGPAGVNINEVIKKVNEETKNFKGLKVPIELDINLSTKEFKIQVFSPPVSELLKKELGIEKGSGMHKKMQVANASIEQIIYIAKTKLSGLLCKDLKAAVKTIVGSCVSLGILIDNKPAVEIEKEIDKGKYDKEIKEEKIETSEAKKIRLEEYFAETKANQEKIIQQEEAIKQAEAEKEEQEKAKPEESEEEAEPEKK